MGLRIATNVLALKAQRTLGSNLENKGVSLERLASGTRINKAGDDAAGLAISEKMKASIRSLAQAGRNANDGISLIQTSEGAMNEVSNILIRLRELSIQAASDTIGDIERGFLEKEVVNLKQEIDRISNLTEYNGTKLLNGTAEPLEIQVGTNNDPFLDRLAYNAPEIVTTTEGLGIGEVTNTNKEGAQTSLALLDEAMTRLNGHRATLGALQNRLGSTMNNINIYKENLSNANSRIRDTDIAEESTQLTRNNILAQANIAVLAQANQNAMLALNLLS